MCHTDTNKRKVIIFINVSSACYQTITILVLISFFDEKYSVETKDMNEIVKALLVYRYIVKLIKYYIEEDKK